VAQADASIASSSCWWCRAMALDPAFASTTLDEDSSTTWGPPDAWAASRNGPSSSVAA